MDHLAKLEAKREQKAKENQVLLPPEILAFARAIRDEFGPGVRLRTGEDWPGGCR